MSALSAGQAHDGASSTLSGLSFRAAIDRPTHDNGPIMGAAQQFPAPSDATLVFGSCSLDLGSARLKRDGRNIPLTPKAFDVLRYLVEHAGRLITKQELFDAIWTDVFVGDAALKVCIREIRRALDDDAQEPTLRRDRSSSRIPFHRAGHAEPNAGLNGADTITDRTGAGGNAGDPLRAQR